jgi:hypothetical protein
VFADVTTESAIGLLVDVRDCATVGTTTVYPTATGVPYELYSTLGAGETLDGQVFFSIDNATLAGLAGSATAAGYAGDLAADGFLLGFVLDATGAPIGGATVSCAGAACTDAWYLDADPSDGLFTTTGAVNAATDPAVGAFLFPMAGIGNYTAEDGGAHAFTPQLNGSNPGVATVTAFHGQ